MPLSTPVKQIHYIVSRKMDGHTVLYTQFCAVFFIYSKQSGNICLIFPEWMEVQDHIVYT